MRAMGHWSFVSLIRRVFEAFSRSTAIFGLSQFAPQRLSTAKHRSITIVITNLHTFFLLGFIALFSEILKSQSNTPIGYLSS